LRAAGPKARIAGLDGDRDDGQIEAGEEDLPTVPAPARLSAAVGRELIHVLVGLGFHPGEVLTGTVRATVTRGSRTVGTVAFTMN
jgi:hypothetical protein